MNDRNTPALDHGKKYEPFGGMAVLGICHDLLLHRLCYSLHTTKPEHGVMTFGACEAMAFLDASNPPPGGRVRWWRTTRDGQTRYICIDPRGPGYRETPPEDAGALVEDLPEGLGDRIFPDIAGRCLEMRKKAVPATSPETMHILKGVQTAARHPHTRDSAGFVAMMEQYSRAIQHGRLKTTAMQQDAINRLYEDGLFEVATDCSTFSTCMALFELQAQTNSWIEQGAYSDALDYLFSFIAGGHVSPAVVGKVGLHHMKAGREVIARALNGGCMWTFQRELYLALHHFWIALILARQSTSKVPYSAMVAEEALACAISGLVCGVTLFYSRSFLDLADTLAASFSRNREEAVRKFMHNHCSEFLPILPRGFARLFVAHAEAVSRAGSPDFLAPIYTADRSIPTVHPTGSLFNSFVRDYLLLNASRQLGLETEMKRYSLAIAARLMMDRAVTGR